MKKGWESLQLEPARSKELLASAVVCLAFDSMENMRTKRAKNFLDMVGESTAAPLDHKDACLPFKELAKAPQVCDCFHIVAGLCVCSFKWSFDPHLN